jgi:hypothetical protein
MVEPRGKMTMRLGLWAGLKNWTEHDTELGETLAMIVRVGEWIECCALWSAGVSQSIAGRRWRKKMK